MSSPDERVPPCKGDEGHSWEFDGDDPYIKCACGEIRDTITGRVIVEGEPSG